MLFSVLFHIVLTVLLSSFGVDAQASTVTEAPSIPTNPPQFTDDSAFRDAVLNSTNVYRAQHNATALAWNATLAQFGQAWSNGCVFKHTGGPYGENLVAGAATATDSIDVWGDERSQYNFGNPGFSEQTGHFTQLVWKTTTDVGCGKTFCNGNNDVPGWYLVCEYFPRGNVIGEFDVDVQATSDAAMRTWPSSTACLTLAIWILYWLSMG